MKAELRLSTHAVERYRQRLDSGATFVSVRAVLRGGRLDRQKPLWVHHGAYDHICDAWVVTRDAVFPMRLVEPGVLLAVTCLKRPRTSKADRRMMRAARREELWKA